MIGQVKADLVRGWTMYRDRNGIALVHKLSAFHQEAGNEPPPTYAPEHAVMPLERRATQGPA